MNTDSKKTIVISAGGTGGHMFPAEALAQDLILRGYHVLLITDVRGNKYTPFAGGIPVHVIRSASIGGGLLGKIRSLSSLALGFFQALFLLRDIKPIAVVGFGGYPSVPAVYAAQKIGIPTVLHEQNAILGRANAFLSSHAQKIAVTWEQVGGFEKGSEHKIVVTGNPVRPDIAMLYNKPYPSLEMDGPLRIFVTGGSLGANVFTKVVPAALNLLPSHYRVRIVLVQQCHETDQALLSSFYDGIGIKHELQSFFTDMAQRFEWCHLVISRSGAGTVCEVTTAGRPAIYVPYPHHADQQQKRNADAMAEVGAAWVMTQNGFTPEVLSAKIETFLQSPEALFRAAERAHALGKPDAARRLGTLVVEVCNGWNKSSNGSSIL